MKKKLLSLSVFLLIAAGACGQTAKVVTDPAASVQRALIHSANYAEFCNTARYLETRLKFLQNINSVLLQSKAYRDVLANQRDIMLYTGRLAKIRNLGELPVTSKRMFSYINATLDNASELVDMLHRSFTGMTRMNDGDRLNILLSIRREQQEVLDRLKTNYNGLVIKSAYLDYLNNLNLKIK